jgi:hypothetical protein
VLKIVLVRGEAWELKDEGGTHPRGARVGRSLRRIPTAGGNGNDDG